MIKIIHNKYNLEEKDIQNKIIRVKALIINDKNELLLGYSFNEYQFIGGHVEENEDLEMAIKREILEETGSSVNVDIPKPFAVRLDYKKDYPTIGVNAKLEIYYYEIKTNITPNINNTNMTNEEKFGGFCLRFINLNDVEEILIDNMNMFTDPNGIANEMLSLIKIYKEKIYVANS